VADAGDEAEFHAGTVRGHEAERCLPDDRVAVAETTVADQLCILVHRPPYGGIYAAEAVRHLNGAAAHGLEATAILLGDGVYLARAGHDPGTTGWTALSPALEEALEGAETGSPRLLVDEESLRQRVVPAESLIPGATVADRSAIAQVISHARWVMVY
jgi:sulfur relay (sulfurtransferase) DsrF/TusC family protein